MANILDWNSNRNMWIRVLHQQSGKGLDYWNEAIKQATPSTEQALRDWLSEHGITGYAANLLVMERFGYPDWIKASADELVDAQYSDRQQLRPIYDAILGAVSGLGEFTIQTRKTYVSLLTPRRTFARIRPSTKSRVDLGLRLEGRTPAGRLRPCNMQATMQVQLGLSSIAELDDEALSWLSLAYKENS